MNPTDLKHQKELNVFRTIPWQEVCKFLAGGFFVNAGILFYLYVARVSVPLWSTGFIETPEVSGVRSIVHAVLLPRFYSRVEKPKPQRLFGSPNRIHPLRLKMSGRSTSARSGGSA